jgi:hypothetical protein
MVILEFLYMCLGYLYIYTVIFITSIIFNLYYFLRFYSLGLWHIIEYNINLFINSTKNIDDVFVGQKLILPKYEYDPFWGILNWFSMVKIVYGRTIFCDDEKHSKDCREFAAILRYFFNRCLIGKEIIHNNIKKKYYKGKVLGLLSMKPFVKNNHTIYIAYWKNHIGSYIDIFTPYRYLTTIRESEYKNIYRYIENEVKNIKYCRFFVNHIF